ncbi:MAG TPA: glycosyltransferase [Actinomycetota bacterium]|nr:glycosyltransferase [Actinomycetota bacterium]
MTTRVLQLDLAAAPSDVAGLEAYDGARVLVRYGSHVVGEVYVPVREGTVTAASVSAALNGDQAARARLSAIIVEDHVIRPDAAVSPSWSVVVCTRDRPEMLRRCIESLIVELDGTGEIIVVDNAPATDATERIAERYPVRYVRENAPGLNRARALGARTSNGDIVIYTDDDTVAEPGWVRALVSEFGGARVGGATGLTMPLELETEAQELFERYGGFSKGFFRQEYDVTKISPSRAGAVGSGASMAFRRDLILSLGLFDVELDLGTASRTGGDTYALYRLLAEGYRIVYTPAALNWHQHRREHDELHTTMAGYGTGLYAFLTRALVEDHEVPALRVGMSWFRKHHLRELARAIARRPNHLSIAMVMAEIRGTLVAPIAYLSSRRAERARASENVGVSGKGAA